MKTFLLSIFLMGIAFNALATTKEVGSYDTAATLTGTERILGDQGSLNTVNILPSQLATYIEAVAGTLLNKTISCASNTCSNIPNSALVDSSITIGSVTLALGTSTSTLSGLSSVAATTFTGALSGQATSAAALAATTQCAAGQTPTGITTAGSANGCAPPGISGGTKFTTTGSTCSISSTTGGATGGTVVTGGGGCNVVLTAGNSLNAPNSIWICTWGDRNQPTVPVWREVSSTATTCTTTLPAAVASADVLTVTMDGR
jgi:hypothetical protein